MQTDVLPPMAHAFPAQSPYQHVLHTNYIPSDEEVTHIRDLCAAPCQRMRTLEDGIAELQATIARKLAELKALSAFTKAHLAKHAKLHTQADAHACAVCHEPIDLHSAVGLSCSIPPHHFLT